MTKSFNAVQARLTTQAVQRKLIRSRSPSILAGLIFDDRGNPMSPSHANKKGVRYRYYISQALLQNRKNEAGSITRVSAPDVEALVCRAVSAARRPDQEAVQTDSDILGHEFISQYVERVVVRADQIAVTLRRAETGAGQSDVEAGISSSTNLMVPFAPRLLPRKGIAHAPAEDGTIDPRTQDTRLHAIARSRRWIDAVLAGQTASFDEIAFTEGLAERHVRRLVPLAFLSPKIVQAISDGTAPAGLTVSRLNRSQPQFEPVSGGAERQIPDIGKSRPETGARSAPKSWRVPASQCLRDVVPSRKARKLRAFPPRRKSVWNSENAWLPFLDDYRTMCLAPEPKFREVLEHVRSMRLAA